jgi:hypothetical protein
VEIENFSTRDEVLSAERRAITEENPRHNLRRPKEERKRAEKAKKNIEESKSELIRRLVVYKPMYTLQEAAAAISINIKLIKKAVACGKLNHILIDTGAKEPKCYISGWQLMDYIESLQCKAI